MFWKTLKAEFIRASNPIRIVVVLMLSLILLIGSDWELISFILQEGGYINIGSVETLLRLFGMDTFKCVMVVLLAGLYTNSFCKDDNSRYLRMILARTDITTYTQCRFIANLCVVILVAVIALYLYVIVMSPFMPLMPEKGTNFDFFYLGIAIKYPILYVGMTGYIFGLVTTACSSIGLLYSTFRPNSFVSIALSGLVFYVALSYIPYESPFNVINIVGMGSSIGVNAPQMLMFLWANMYMISVIGICGVLFWKRMKWRVENGYV